jgi:hypothetical protein
MRAYDSARLVDTIEEQLSYEPTTITRNRKPVVRTLATEQLAITWELRVGAWRVFYDVEPEGVLVVRIVQKGTKTTEEIL